MASNSERSRPAPYIEDGLSRFELRQPEDLFAKGAFAAYGEQPSHQIVACCPMYDAAGRAGSAVVMPMFSHQRLLGHSRRLMDIMFGI
ncbi:hypothetical protein X759_32655 [Mesorhizobium sp. LSHC420B00]|nr:hypothetical protein X759_32655 [Mesorhizobium sp. LSHC420B00]